MAEFRIISKYGHWEAVDRYGRIIVTGDTYDEVEEEIKMLETTAA